MSFLEIDSVSKQYDDTRAVSEVSFHVGREEAFALVGPDGAGKTTLMRALCNLIAVDGGSALLDGIDLFKEFDRAKPVVGYMPQQFSLYPDLSIEENMTFYAGLHGITGRKYRERRDQLYEFSNLEPFADRRAGALSGGMKQKLALSCALIHGPRMLILDEPTTGVDPLSRRQFWEMLGQLKEDGVSILASTPYMDEVERTDRACFMFGGRKLAEGTPQELTRLFEGSVYAAEIDPTPQLVNRVAAIEGISAGRFGASLHVYLDEELDLDQVADKLSDVGLGIDQLKAIEPDLEDVFIQQLTKQQESPDG
jgi:ABC-type multidrug transport system ATPase subunit